MPKTTWIVRHSTALLLGAGVLLFADSRVTNLLIEAPDPSFDFAKEWDRIDGWRDYVEKGGSREKAQVELERYHDRAREHLRDAGAPHPEGLDPLLELLRERVDERVYLHAEPIEIDEASFSKIELPDQPDVQIVPVVEHLGHADWSCARGLTAAFASATGSDVVDVQTPDEYDADPTSDAPKFSLRWSAAANGELYGQSGKRVFPGFSITASLQLTAGDATLALLDATFDPGQTIEYTTYGLAPMFDGDHADVVIAMVEAACKRMGEQLIGELTGWAPPAAAVSGDAELEQSCEGGDASACITLGDSLQATDPQGAIAWLEKGCSAYSLGGGAACVAAAELSLAHPDDPISPTAKASVLLDTGCQGNHALACALAAELDLAPLSDGEPRSAHAQGEAYLGRLRACDLGAAEVCALAAEQAELGSGQEGEKASSVRAMLLFRRSCAAGATDACERAEALREAAKGERTIDGVALAADDEPFDVRWGMWLEHAETEIVWIASAESRGDVETRLAVEIAQQRARVYDPLALPPGPNAPEGARTIYAVAKAADGVFREPRACPECVGDVQPLYAMPGCVCLPQ